MKKSGAHSGPAFFSKVYVLRLALGICQP
jgi:hypothetical protein